MRTRAIITVVILALTCFTALGQFGFSNSGGTCAIAQQYRSSDYLNWYYSTNLLPVLSLPAAGHATFGGPPIWDSAAGVYRLYVRGYTAGVDRIHMYTSTNANQFSAAPVDVLTGTPAGWDQSGCTVPFVWYESGATRPWRMLYAGEGLVYLRAIGLATSIDGVTWEKKDTAGNALTLPVITNGVVIIDFGNCFKAGSTYYVYYDTVANPRVTRLTTSTDLVNWTAYLSATNLFWPSETAGGAWDYSDATHTAFATNTVNGWFCPWVGRWDRSDGVLEYRMYIPSYDNGGASSRLVCFTSKSPLFDQASRTYQGTVIDFANPYYIITNQLTKLDTPRMSCVDAEQNMSKQLDAKMWLAILTTNNIWTESVLRQPGSVAVSTENTATLGATLSNCFVDGNAWNPSIALSFTTTTDVVYHFAPSRTGSYIDVSGYGCQAIPDNVIPRGGPVPVDTGGATFSGSHALEEYYDTTFAQLTNITQDFTIEATVNKPSLWGNSVYGAIFFDRADATHNRLLFDAVTSAGGDSATYFSVRIHDSGGTTRTSPQMNVNWSDNRTIPVAASIKSGKIYWFTNGVAYNAGGTAFNYALYQSASAQIGIGVAYGGSELYLGQIDDIRYSNYGRYTAGYTVATLPINYVASGQVFTGVYDTGIPTYSTVDVTGSVPAGCAITTTHRIAANATDKSVTAGDFAAGSAFGRYHQWCIILTGPGTVTPTITNMAIRAWQ